MNSVIDEIRDIEKNTNGSSWIVKKIKGNNNIISFFNDRYPSYIGDVSSQYFFYVNGTEEKLCPVCGDPVANPRKNQTCTKRCAHVLHSIRGNYSARYEKTKNTNLIRYGHESPNANDSVQSKRKATMMEKYGSLASDKARESARKRSNDLNAKSRETLMERYGVSNSGQLPNHSRKVKATLEEKYGVDHITKSTQYKEKRKKSRIQHWSGIISDSIVTDVEFGIIGMPNERIHISCLSCLNDDIIPHETVKWRLRNFDKVCRSCIGITSNSSGLENELYDFINSIYSGTILRNDKKAIGPYELDILLPECNIAIEFNGLYWHSIEAGKDKYYHRTKYDRCNDNDISLIQIFEDEWIFKKDIVKSVIKSKLGIIDKRIYARKCEIMEIDHVDAREFLDKTHLMGYKKCTKKYGLLYDGELVQVMTFSSGNKSRKQYGWEIDRFATELNTVIVGGASKLFNAFLRDVKPDEVVSYADLRYGSGETYGRVGMNRESDTSVGYWYFKPSEIIRIHRFALRKTDAERLEKKTEFELRAEQGYYRIYDVGNAKWRYKK